MFISNLMETGDGQLNYCAMLLFVTRWFRFEGNYFNNKRDGHGSFYEVPCTDVVLNGSVNW